MKTLPFTSDELLNQYKIDLNQLLDDCDWISTVEDWRLCSLVADVCTKKGVKVNSDKLLKLYNKKVKSLKLTTKQWHEQYGDWETGVPKIIGILYEIIKDKFGSSE